MFTQLIAAVVAVSVIALSLPAAAAASGSASVPQSSARLERQEGFVDGCGAIVFYESIGHGAPLMVFHGGPGVPHGYFLPYLLPLARHHRLIFIDERGGGRSQRLSDHTQYTLDTMACDADAVRRALGFSVTDVFGHSFGGILAQAYAIKYPATVRRLILGGTGSSAARINADFKQIKESLEPALLSQILALEAKGIVGADGAQLPEYRKLSDQAELPYNYAVRPPSWDDSGDPTGWDVLNEMWGSRSDFHIDGNLAGFDFTPQLRTLSMRTLILFGDHDLISTTTATQTHEAIRHSEMVMLANCAHMTFVDQPDAFMKAVSSFLDN